MLFFEIVQVLPFPEPPIVENFDTPNPAGVSGAATWTGNGFLQATFPLELTGTGADGNFSPAAAQTTILDTAQLVGGQPRMGLWNFQSVNIPATATVRVIGPYLAHIRCTGTFTLNGIVNANAATGVPTSPNLYDRGPEQGIQNNNGGLNCEANGGVGNAGGGAGGTGFRRHAAAGEPRRSSARRGLRWEKEASGPPWAGS